MQITQGKFTMNANRRKQNPTNEESKLALQAQSPVDENRHETGMIASFKQLAKTATNARMLFGGNGQWIKADELFRDDFQDGRVSRPFVITKACKYTSKTLGDRFGMEIITANKRCYNVGMPFNENDSKRVALLDHFSEKTAAMLGPVALQKLDLGKGNPYYDIIPYELSGTNAPVEIPFQDINFDSEIPF